MRVVLLSMTLAVSTGVSEAFMMPIGRSVMLRRGQLRMCDGKDKKDSDGMMQRPVLDNVVTKAIYSAEMMRIKMMKEGPTEENGGWDGEPRAWANDNSLAQKVSKVSQIGVFASFKQWIAESIAGNYDKEAINKRIDDTLAATPVVMFSFTTCPFCLKAKGLLQDEIKLDPSMLTIIECDDDAEGNAIRAELGRRTGRTSMPSIWIKDSGYIGGCNDGPGIMPLQKEGKLVPMLVAAGALEEF
mmetsp:Transcript_65866/g.106804  ORF Transcript_65866/g.106804 Transcript_65866/m.106804 type:complete len:243 (-) Transcript_65866:118-846(-)|eukprot:CAMPEP_0173082610 /NCGR_PEP_ID=MMETSP1102-20130122/18459_1 /TAXON_ID=49646 /ORGANISM="Geminigera sp., Strain Caron Lab Isolate" /LENGTH=242 /DNA_ID=CAMNT_0013958391 /DNA_START=1 /DNA_END=729 /DNA_ORIENTATION=+